MKLIYAGRTAVLAVVLLTLVLHNALAVSLNRYNSCPDLVSYFKTNARSRVGAYGLSDSRNFGGFRPFFPCGPLKSGPGPQPVFLESAAFGGDGGNQARGLSATTSSSAAPQSAPQPTEQVAGVDFSETNVQVEGVDEPDIIKTDGSRVFVVRGRNFFVLSVGSGGKNGRVTGKLTLPSHAREMLIEGNHLLVIAQTHGNIYPTPRVASSGFFIDQSLTTVYQIKVTHGIPKLVATLRMEGRYLNSREVNGVARIVMLYRPRLRFLYPTCVIPYAEAEAQNQEIIQSSNERDWYPSYSLKVEGQSGETSDLISSCSNVYIPGIFPGFDLLTVVTLPVSGSLRPTGSVSIVSEGDEVYATATSLYVTTTEYRWDFFGFENSIRSGRDFETSIHKFSLNNYGANYVASGEVSGSVLNQFSMHEYDGYFFIATTDGAPWWGARDESSSKVTSFKTSGRRLQKVGEVGNLGLGERIFAVRYVKDTAYVVTFRQIDPLYIIDLSRPWLLRVTGELKIPGFSSYLHPISPGRILGVGQDATPEGRTTGAKVTLFDVSDKTNPTELSSWTLPGSSTSAQWDHRAFLYWEPESVAVLPVSAYLSSNRFIGSVVLDVSESDIRERGRVTHEPPSSSRYSPSIERNVVLGGEHLWSLSSKQIQVNNIRDLSKESVTTLN
ncbi:hypothetical protein FGB62_86g02 [Gracilaria domingensis]|nr:hypothetical protein FGB62_86g02 [Gracilaria domingensis]